MKKLLALVYGVLAYAFFLGTFLYAIAFLGDVRVPKTVDTGKPATLAAAIVIDALLLGAFAIQHSVMARQWFKQRWTKVVSWYVERSTFVVAASAVLALLLWQWRPIPQVVWEVRDPRAEWLLVVLFWVGWATLLVSTFLIDHFELFGLAQVWAYWRGREFHRLAFKTPSLYRLVRHPMYLGFTIAFWSAPRMTVGHLLFSVAATGYLIVGIYFEERDLVGAFGDDYRDYRARVPMLIPFLKRPGGRPERDKATTA